MKIALSGIWFVIGAALVTGCHGGGSTAPVVLQTMQARVVQSQWQAVPVDLRATGTVRARQTAAVSAQVTGAILQVLVREGDAVRAGQSLVVIDGAALHASVEQAQAGVKAAESERSAVESDARLAATTLDRYRLLEAQKSVSPQEMDEVSRRADAAAARLAEIRAQVDGARAQESAARTMLGYTHLTAPFNGVVVSRLADPGTMASPGVPLLQIDQSGALQLQVTVDESAIGAVHKGMKSRISIDGATAPEIAGVVSEILPAADAASHTFLVKIDLPASSLLRSGMYGAALFPSGVRQAIIIPRSAVVLRGSLPCAYVLDGHGVAQLRYLTLGERHGALVEVLSGLSAAEKIVDDPADRELAGKSIEVQQ